MRVTPHGLTRLMPKLTSTLVFFFFNDTATTEIYTLSLHDALPISVIRCPSSVTACRRSRRMTDDGRRMTDRKSTRLNSSHGYISYAVFCLKKKKRITSPSVQTSFTDKQRDATSPHVSTSYQQHSAT